MFKKDSCKRKESLNELKKSSPRPVYKESKNEIIRSKRCNSSNSPRHIITALDNFINKLNDKRKTLLVPSHSYSSDSSVSTCSSLTISNSSVDSSTKTKSKIKDSPKIILKSTQNYIRSFKRPGQSNSLKLPSKSSDLFFDHFNSNRLDELEKSSILKSLLDSQQYAMIKNRLSQSNMPRFDETSSCSDTSNNSCIIHDNSDDNSNQTFVEHSDEDENDEDLPSGWSYDFTKNGRKYYIDNVNHTSHWERPNKIIDTRKNNEQIHSDYTKSSEGYNELLAKLSASYLKSPHSIVNKVQIPDWLIELSNFDDESIQWESLDIKSLELYDLMLQRIHKCELMELIENHEKYRAKLNELLVKS
ncbi:unnamed protein product [Brachionus calyciflorus]|uniref:WW domain-containing protein n=1 Tax=Brachionus calyciflorus TaxID=104777 RepID=A0A813QU24_9BILA|nr:unnamed protein product [Brachionus calyciflorus]